MPISTKEARDEKSVEIALEAMRVFIDHVEEKEGEGSGDKPITLMVEEVWPEEVDLEEEEKSP